MQDNRADIEELVLEYNMARMLLAEEEEEEEEEEASIVISIKDITQRKQAEKKLRESEEKYRTILENIEDGYFEVDIAGNFTFFNDSLCWILGYSREEMLGMNDRQYTDQENAKKLYQAFNKVYKTGEPEKGFDRKVIRKDGTIRFVEASVSLIKDYRGQPIGFRGIVRDITERKNNEEKMFRQSTLLNGVNKVLIEALTCQTDEEIANKCLNVAQVLTKSKFGFIGEMNQTGRFDTIAMSDPGWEACRIPRSDSVLLINNMEVRGIWANVLKEERSLIVNDPAAHPNRVGTPEGHPPLTSFLGVPLKHLSKTIGMIALANKETGYDSIDQNDIETLCTVFVEALMRKRAEEALNIEKQRFQTLSEQAPFGMVMIDQDGTFKYMNPKFRELFGYDLTDIPDGKTWFRKAYPNPTYRHDVIEAWKNDLKSSKPGEKRSRIFTVICKDKTEKTINFIPVQLETSENLMACEDITERKRAEEALRASEGRLRHLFDDAPVGYHEFDTEGRITRVNRTELEMLGYTAEEMLGRYIWDFIVEEVSREAVKAKLAGKLPPGRAIERTYQQKDGTTFPVLIEERLIKDGKGRITGIRTTIQDITERKRAEETLQRSEEKANRLSQENAIIAEIGRLISSTFDIDEVYEGFAEEVDKLLSFDRISITLYNSKEGNFITAYVSGLEVEGRRKGDVYPFTGSTIEEMMCTRTSVFVQTESMEELQNRFPGLLPTFQAGIRSMLSVPLIARGEVIGALHLRSKKPKAYTEQDMEVSKSVANQIAGAIANAQLFSEHKQDKEALTKAYAELQQTQAQLIQAEKAEVIGRLASGVAHQVKNPLAIILQGIDYLYANVPLDNENVSFTFNDIKNAVRKADNIIKGLLDFSRVAEIKRAPGNLNPIIEGALLFVESLLDRYHIEVIKEFGKDILSLNLDKIRIEQLFLNLFINVIDAMPVGGQLKIRTYNKELTEVSEEVGRREGDIFEPGNTAVIAEIEDTGTGIPEGILEKIFDPFFTTKQNKGGTGLGLSVVRNIVEVHDGRIKIENRKDRSGVRVTLMFKA